MRRVSLNSVRIFDAAARHLNFRLAADELNLTQGAVAQQVRRLEADLGLRLFYRQARGLAFTDAGRNYYKAVHEALVAIDEATEKLRPESARVTLSLTPSFASKWLVPRLARFATAWPDIILQTIATEQLADFAHDGVDIAIRQGNPTPRAELQIELLAQGSLSAVCSRTVSKRVGVITQLEDFTKHPLIQDGHNSWDLLLRGVNVQRLPRMMRFNRSALAIEAAASAQGIALVPHILVEPDVDEGKLVELWRVPSADESYYMIFRKDPRPRQAVETVVKWILAEAQNRGNKDHF